MICITLSCSILYSICVVIAVWCKFYFILQACLAEVNKDKGTEPVHLYAKIGDQKLVIGILSHDKFPQISVDLIFDAEFELSHNWKNGSVHFTGYKALIPSESGESLAVDL